MIIILNELRDNKDHWFEVELYNNNGGASLNIIDSKECNSFQETNDFIIDLDRQGKIRYYDLTLDYNNRKFSNIMSLEDLLSLIRNNRTGL